MQKAREACSFIGRNGEYYVRNNATKNERKYFEGILYNKDGNPIEINLTIFQAS